MDMYEILNTFFRLLKSTIHILLFLPIVLLIIGSKINSKLFQELSIKLFIFGIIFAVVLTIFDFIQRFI